MNGMKTIKNTLPTQILSKFNTFESQIKVLDKQMEMNRNAMVELELQMFEFMYSVLIPEKQREKTVKAVKEIRQKGWDKALKQAKGNKEKAFEIWAGLSS